jgi:hypothetical protein
LRKKHFGVLLTILTMWFEFFIHFSCSFKFLITILSFYCVFVHPCSICSSYIRFVFCFWRLLFWGFTRIFVFIQHLNYYFVDLLEIFSLMFTLVFDIFIMCFILSEILSFTFLIPSSNFRVYSTS